MSRYFVLVDDGESVEQPGALARMLDDGSDFALMVDKDEWESQPALARYFVQGEAGAEWVTRERAQELIASFPWPGSRFPRAQT